MNERQDQKVRWERYREAARRLYPQATFSPICHISEPADRDGAFIEITVWIPASELQCGAVHAKLSLTCSLLRDHMLPHFDRNANCTFSCLT